jgi:hypothetical protein
MGCARIKTDIGTGFVCGDDEAVVACHFCGYWSEYLCDYPVGEGKTCDLPLCIDCINTIGDDLDLCPIHYAEFVSEKKVGVRSGVIRIKRSEKIDGKAKRMPQLQKQ